MAFVIVISRTDKNLIESFNLNRKIVLGSSVYCDVVLENKVISSMQLEIQIAKTGHVLVSNLDLKRDILINQTRLKSLVAFRPSDTIKVGNFVLQFDQAQLTAEESELLNSEYEKIV